LNSFGHSVDHAGRIERELEIARDGKEKKKRGLREGCPSLSLLALFWELSFPYSIIERIKSFLKKSLYCKEHL